MQADLAGGTVPSLSFEAGGRNILEVVVAGDSAGFSVNGVFVSELNASELHGASDVWVGSGFHQANAVDGEVTRFEDFTVWSLETAEIASGRDARVAPAHARSRSPRRSPSRRRLPGRRRRRGDRAAVR